MHHMAEEVWHRSDGMEEGVYNGGIAPQNDPSSHSNTVCFNRPPFQNSLDYRLVICNLYNRHPDLSSRVPTPLMWDTARLVVDTLQPVVELCVLNQGSGNWNLGDAVHSALKLATDLLKKK